ncbi:MAG TPA: YhbY family RNA-binding protein, partial [Candidatus Sumerlaeota bacterium]|nr:YhbY family RNA-binding protein [Candidatus Sumerlaeota bacterium]
MATLTGADRQYLRALAHHLEPLVKIGKMGLTPALIKATQLALDEHELIKVRFIGFKEEKKNLSVELAQQTECEQVGQIGNTVIYYRPNSDPEKRKIDLANPQLPVAPPKAPEIPRGAEPPKFVRSPKPVHRTTRAEEDAGDNRPARPATRPAPRGAFKPGNSGPK